VAARAQRFGVLARFGPHLQVVLDLLAWCAALFLALCIRYDFANGWDELVQLGRLVPLVLVAQFWIGVHVGLYQRRWRFGSFEEVRALALTAAGVGALVTAIDAWFLEHVVPISVPPGAAVIALVGMLGPRYLWRMVADRSLRPDPSGAERLVVIGAGEGGAQAVTAMLRNRESPYLPVALLDDDPDKRRLSILGVPVLASTASLEAVCRELDVRQVLLAIPSAPAELVRSMTERCQNAGLALLVVPQTRRLYGRVLSTDDIRRPTAADLLGRRRGTRPGAATG